MSNSKAVVKKGNTLPAIGDFGAHKGVGKAQIKDQVLVPQLVVLQDLSPLVKADDAPAAAKAGAMLNTGTDEIIARGDSILGVPVWTELGYVERTPQTKGRKFVKRHSPNAPIVLDAIKAAQATDQPWALTVQDGENKGNEIFETHYVAFLLISDFENPEVLGTVVLAFSRTKIIKWRQYVTKIEGFKGASNVPIYANVARIGTVTESRNGNTWWNFELLPAIEVDGVASAAHSVCDPENEAWASILEQARELYEKSEKGEVRAADDHPEESSSDSDKDPI